MHLECAKVVETQYEHTARVVHDAYTRFSTNLDTVVVSCGRKHQDTVQSALREVVLAITVQSDEWKKHLVLLETLVSDHAQWLNDAPRVDPTERQRRLTDRGARTWCNPCVIITLAHVQRGSCKRNLPLSFRNCSRN